MARKYQATSRQPIFRVVPRLALRADMAAQARHYNWTVPGTGTVGAGPGQAWAVLFSAMPEPA
jgi:hypothetical protein